MNPITVRCKGCNRWLATVTVLVGAIKCPRCKMIFEYKILSNLHMNNTVDPSETRDIMQPETSRVQPDNRATTSVNRP